MRPIDADALIQFFQSSKNQKAFYTYFTTTDIIRVLDNTPTLALDEMRPKGEWISYEPEIALYGCSNCDHMIFHAIDLPKYCPNCGAKMGGGE